MADLIAIGYPDEKTAEEAAKEVERLSEELIIEPEAIAVIKRDQKGKYHVTTTHDIVATGTVWGMFWGVLFGILFLIPLIGLAIGAGLGALTGLITEKTIGRDFVKEVRDLLQPGTSALFMVVDKITTDKALAALKKYGGTVLKTSLPGEMEQQLRAAIESAPAAT
ncbi:MAG: hypothetical protein JWN46_3346 [Acidimicrobiales bacterium]|nr:hypothetical protein [Acidimicrobiales bacterium]